MLSFLPDFYQKLRVFCSSESMKAMKRQDTDWEKVPAIHIPTKGLIFRIYKDFLQTIKKTIKKNIFKKSGQNTPSSLVVSLLAYDQQFQSLKKMSVYVQRKTCTRIFIAVWFIITKKGEATQMYINGLKSKV